MALDQIKTKGTLANKAYDVLKEAIMTLELSPGEVLLEDDLSEKLGISRTPIRSALQKLSYEGFIRFSGKSTSVTTLTTDYFLDLFAIREALELLSVKLAALNRTEGDLKSMAQIIKRQQLAAKESPINTIEYLKIDREYHHLLASMSKNQLLVNNLKNLHEAYNRYLNFTEFESRAFTVVTEHADIYNAVKIRDTQQAQNLMRLHLNDVKESIILSLLKKGPF